jgi:peptidoglycan/LPS O-acetylase OafA/YrhL
MVIRRLRCEGIKLIAMNPESVPARETGDSLTPLRGVAAVFVLMFHTVGDLPLLLTKLGWFGAILSKFYLWVDFFFILSGYVIMSAYGRRLSGSGLRTRLRFLMLRLGRIYPLHLVTLTAMVALELLIGAMGRSGEPPFSLKSRSLISIPTNLLLIQSIGIHSGFSWNTPAWSISCEWVAYVCFAVWAGLAFRIRLRTAAVVMLSCGVGYLIMWMLRGSLDATYDYGVIRCHLGFIAGAMLQRFVARCSTTDSGSTLIFLSSLIVTILGFCIAALMDVDWVVIPPFILLCFVMARPAASVRKYTLETRVLQWTGKISYSIYMTHWILIATIPAAFSRILHIDLRQAEGTLTQNLAAVAITFILTVLISILSFRYVEEPSRKYCRKLVGELS